MSKLTHLGEILITLQYKKFATASELAEVLGVDKKTIYRYIESLIEANIPIQTRKGRNGGFFLDGDFWMRQPSLTIEEMEALLLASEILTSKNGFAFEHHLKSAVTKVANVSQFDDKCKYYMVSNDKMFYDAVGGINNFEDSFSKICCAVESGRAVEVCYSTKGKTSIRKVTIDPYNLIFKEARWYLIGMEHEQNKVEAYELTRIKDINISKYIYIKPSNFSLGEYLSKCWGTFSGDQKKVSIRFDSEARSIIEREKWHPLQRIESNEEGSIVLSFFIDSLQDIKGWILGFGAAAEVLEPDELRLEIKEEINKLKKIYNS